MGQYSARVRFIIPDNATWADALQFGTDGDTTWSFTGQNFRMDIKGDREDTAALLSLTSGAGEIVVDDADTRVLHFDVPEATIQAALVPGCYLYDFVMIDDGDSTIRVTLMHGTIEVVHGITGG